LAVLATYGGGQPSRGRRGRGSRSMPTAAATYWQQSASQSVSQSVAPSPYDPNSGDPIPTSYTIPMNTDPAPVMPQGGANQGDILTGLAALISGIVAQQVSAALTPAMAEVKAIAEAAASKAAAAANNGVTLVELVTPTLPVVSLGVQHKQFPTLLKMVSARQRSGNGLNIWVHGPAGTGKTTAAENVAEALDLPFRYNGALDTRYELLGFIDAQGRTIRTAFREAWEHGGIYLFDEIDASNPNALLALNGALANAVCPFPDGMVKRHKDCVVLAGANTTGAPTIEYVGRMKQDASLLDRFAFLDWPIDEGLEAAICGDKNWVARVQRIRRNVADRKIKGVLITPRATIYGESLLAAGLSLEAVENAVLRKGISADIWQQIS
jgi:cobaltochelatase CobS